MNEILALFVKHGPALVFVVAFLEQIGAPVPAIPVIIVAGAVAANSGASIGSLLLLTLAGALIADTVWFFLGRRHGNKVLGFLCRISLSPDSCVSKTERFFDRWGFQSLIFAKFIPGFSIIAPPLAGALPNATYRKFLFYDSIGALLWGAAALGVGVLFHDAIDRVLDALSLLGNWALLLIGSVVALFILFKWWERKRFYKTLRLARISVSDLHQRLSSGQQTTILDVRGASARKREPKRIPGALTVITESLDDTLRDLPPDQELVVYCT